MDIKNDILQPLIKRDVNYPSCLVIKASKEAYEKFISGASFEPTDSIEILYIGRSWEEASQWLDTQRWDLLGVDAITGRPILEILGGERPPQRL